MYGDYSKFFPLAPPVYTKCTIIIIMVRSTFLSTDLSTNEPHSRSNYNLIDIMFMSAKMISCILFNVISWMCIFKWLHSWIIRRDIALRDTSPLKHFLKNKRADFAFTKTHIVIYIFPSSIRNKISREILTITNL